MSVVCDRTQPRNVVCDRTQPRISNSIREQHRFFDKERNRRLNAEEDYYKIIQPQLENLRI